MLTIHRSPDTEALFEALAELLAVPGRDPLARESIVVPGMGLARWLGLRLSERFRSWSNADFPFPRAVIERLLERGRRPLPRSEIQAWSAEGLSLRIAALLPRLVTEDSGFGAVRRWLDQRDSQEASFELGHQLGELFDHYQLYRPEMIRAWERGERGDGDAGWQSELWRRLVAERDSAWHLVRRAARLVEGMAGQGPDEKERLVFFGVTTLPPLFLEILRTLSRSVDLHLFVPAIDLEANRRLEDTLGSHPLLAAAGRREIESVAVESGLHPLARRWGRQLYEFHAGSALVDAERIDVPCRPEVEQGLLRRLRRHLAGGARAEAQALDAQDQSLSIHSCHSAQRQVEVLHDRLLQCFADLPDLDPSEVGVIVPDMERFRPAIEAIFDPGSGRSAIPFQVAHAGSEGVRDILRTLDRALDVATGRLSVDELLDLLALPLVATRWSLEECDRSVVRSLLNEASVRWGSNAGHRQAEGQPPTAQNTWEFGLDRLFLGIASGGEAERRLFSEVLPVDDIEGAAAWISGRVAALEACLRRWRPRLAHELSLGEWCLRIGAFLREMIEVEDRDEADLASVTRSLIELADSARAAGFEDRVGLRVFRRLLSSRAGLTASGRGILESGVSFGDPTQMRGIPFRVIALLGLDDEAFPRSDSASPMDLRAQRPRIGDRSLRDDDRQLFLETLFAAGDRLLLFHDGRSERENRPLLPSSLVIELKTEVARICAASDEEVEDALVTQHPLHPFAARAFRSDSPPTLRSFAVPWFAGAKRQLEGARSPDPFFPEALPIDAGPREITPAEFATFFRFPARELLKRGLGLRLHHELELSDPREPMELEGLERWQLAETIIHDRLEEIEAEETQRFLRASGVLPLGAPGECLLRKIESTVDELVELSREYRQDDGELGHRDIDLLLDELRVVGRLEGVGPRGLLRLSYSSVAAKHRLAFWIGHLLLCASAPETSWESLLVGRGSAKKPTVAFRAAHVPDAIVLLRDFAAVHRRGLAQPLPFFPVGALRFVKAEDGGATLDEALEAAGEADQGLYAGDQAYLETAFRGRDPKGDDGGKEYAELARRLVEPMLRGLEPLS